MLDIGLAPRTGGANVNPPLVTEQVKLFVDPADDHLKFKDKAGAITDVTEPTGEIGLVIKDVTANIDPPANASLVKLYVDSADNLLKRMDNAGLVIPVVPTKFASFWQTVADVTGTIAANNGKVLFQTPSSNNTGELTTVAGSGDILVGAAGAGVYEIDWGVSGAEANAFGLFIDGALVTGTVEGSGAVTQQNSGRTIVRVLAGEVISLRTVDCAAVITLQLAGTTNAAQNVASIRFKFIGS